MEEMVRKNILKAFNDGRLEEVDLILQDILEKDPDHAQAIQFLGAKYLFSHQAPYAIALIGNFLEKKKKENVRLLRNDEARLYQTLGRALLAENHFEAALVAFKNAVRLLPEEAAHHASLGEVLLSLSRYDEALSPLETALRLAPYHADIMLFLVQAYFALGNSLKAAFYCRLFLELRPNAPVMRANLGAILLGLDELEEACSTLERALKEGCDTPETRMNLALAALRLGDVKRACHLFKVALADSGAFSSSVSEVYYRILLNYGTALYEAGRYREAEKAFCEIENAESEALILEKSQASFNRAAIFLACGQWREGWHFFEKRLLFSPLLIPEAYEAFPLWDGQEKGGILILYAEQGLGDMVQFLRYLPKILETHFLYLTFSQEQKDFIEEFLVVPPSLKGKILNNLQRDEKIDGRVSLLSLPYYLGEEGFSPRPYLKNIVLQKEECFKIGLSWQGNKNYAFDRRRSLSFSFIEEAFFEISQKYPVNFISLQKREGKDQYNASWLAEGKNENLSDLSYMISQCDLIITIDSLAAHIAGAMGKKLWLLNRFGGDWRWKHKKIYQDVTIFQAQELARPEEEWREVLKKLMEDLKDVVRLLKIH